MTALEEVRESIARMLAQEPSRRPADGAAVLAELSPERLMRFFVRRFSRKLCEGVDQLIVPTAEYAEGRHVLLTTAHSVYTLAFRHLVEQRPEWSWATVQIVEKISATQKSTSSIDKSGKVAASIRQSALFGRVGEKGSADGQHDHADHENELRRVALADDGVDAGDGREPDSSGHQSEADE